MLFAIGFVFLFTIGGLTGIILANASLDIALHDEEIEISELQYYIPDGPTTLLVVVPATQLGRRNCNLTFPSTQSYIIPFFIGLLEGDGCITVGLANKKYVRVRIFISLKNLPENVEMLNLIKTHIGGKVNIERKDQYVTWIACNKKDVKNVFNIIEKYPLLTSRKICQYKFALHCFNNPDMDNYMEMRDNKYLSQLDSNKFIEPDSISYFPAWLSGFIEAEGHFKLSLRETGGIRSHQFCIGQDNDKYILEMIKVYLNSNHKIIQDKNKRHFRIHIGGLNSKKNIYEHFTKYPLLGAKLISYNKWIMPLLTSTSPAAAGFAGGGEIGIGLRLQNNRNPII